MNIFTTTNAIDMYVTSWTEPVEEKEEAFLLQILGTNSYYFVNLRQIEEYLTKKSEYFDGHRYYTNVGKIIRNVVAGNLPTEELAITLLEGGSYVHVGTKLAFRTPPNTNLRTYEIIMFQNDLIRTFASYIAMKYANEATVSYNKLDPFGGFTLYI